MNEVRNEKILRIYFPTPYKVGSCKRGRCTWAYMMGNDQRDRKRRRDEVVVNRLFQKSQ